MVLKAYTSADSSLLLPLYQYAYSPALGRLDELFADTQPHLIMGDPTLAPNIPGLPSGSVCRLTHYQLPPSHPILPGQFATQVADLIPLPIAALAGDSYITVNMLPLLAEALGQYLLGHPRLAPLPVWAWLAPQLVALFAQVFPSAQISGSYIWEPSLASAAGEVAALRPR